MKKFLLIINLGMFFLITVNANAVLPTTTSGEKHRVNILTSKKTPHFKTVLKGFQDNLKEINHEIIYEIDYLSDDQTENQLVLSKVINKKPDLIFAIGMLAIQSILKQNHTIPVVASMFQREDMLKDKFNTTGVFLEFSLETQLAWMQRIINEPKKIGVVYNAVENQQRVKTAMSIACKNKFELTSQKVNTIKEIPLAFKHIANQSEVIWGIMDEIVMNNKTAKSILYFSFQKRIPLVGPSDSWVKAGALYALGWDFYDIGWQCSDMAFSILHGQSPGVPVPPRKVVYSLNLRTARYMKISIPQIVIKNANKVYED